MCRLTAYVGEPLTADALVFGGTHSLVNQSYVPRELLHGHVNADGYGVVWYRGTTPVRTGGACPIWQDTDLRTLLEGVSSSTILASVRNATPGIPIEGGNQPLLHGRWTFVLNGFVENFRTSHMRALRSHLPDDLYGHLSGSSDSETLFLLAVEIRQRTDRVAADTMLIPGCLVLCPVVWAEECMLRGNPACHRNFIYPRELLQRSIFGRSPVNLLVPGPG